MIIIFGGDGRCWEDKCQITCLGIHVCADKISCLPWEINGGCIEIAVDSNPDRPTLTVHSDGRARSARYKERSKAIVLSENSTHRSQLPLLYQSVACHKCRSCA